MRLENLLNTHNVPNIPFTHIEINVNNYCWGKKMMTFKSSEKNIAEYLSVIEHLHVTNESVVNKHGEMFNKEKDLAYFGITEYKSALELTEEDLSKARDAGEVIFMLNFVKYLQAVRYEPRIIEEVYNSRIFLTRDLSYDKDPNSVEFGLSIISDNDKYDLFHQYDMAFDVTTLEEYEKHRNEGDRLLDNLMATSKDMNSIIISQGMKDTVEYYEQDHYPIFMIIDKNNYRVRVLYDNSDTYEIVAENLYYRTTNEKTNKKEIHIIKDLMLVSRRIFDLNACAYILSDQNEVIFLDNAELDYHDVNGEDCIILQKYVDGECFLYKNENGTWSYKCEQYEEYDEDFE